MFKEQRIRMVLFYLALAVFIVGLPFILSFALGYKFDQHTLKFAKTGIISIKTQPPGASVYLQARLLNEKTPTSINELLPRTYYVGIELEEYYPWEGLVRVNAGKVTRLEKIILFPLRPNIKQLNKEKVRSFWVDEDTSRVYYISSEDNIIYESGLEGERFEEIGTLPQLDSAAKKFKISPDKEKLLAFNLHQMAIVDLKSRARHYYAGAPVVLELSSKRIVDVFWHSDSFHLVLITDRDIEVIETNPEARAVILANLTKKDVSYFYDTGEDTMYFIDTEKATDGKLYDNVYKLEVGFKFDPFKDLIKINQDGQ